MKYIGLIFFKIIIIVNFIVIILFLTLPVHAVGQEFIPDCGVSSAHRQQSIQSDSADHPRERP